MPDNLVTRIDKLLPMLHADTRANLVAWTDAFLVRQFNDGLREAARTTGLFVKRVSNHITLIASVSEYTLPADLLSLIRVALNNVPLIPSTMHELESLSETFQVDQGTPTHWYVDRSRDFHVIGLYPVPNAGVAGLKLDLIYHFLPCAWAEDHSADALDAPLIFGDMVELRALAEAYHAETDFAMPEVAQAARQAMAQLYNPQFMALYGPDH